MFGDSSIDMLKVTAEFKQRQAWPTIVGQFDEAGYRVANMACGGAPMYQLCLVSPCVLCCNKPTTGIITAMGGNDFRGMPRAHVLPGLWLLLRDNGVRLRRHGLGLLHVPGGLEAQGYHPRRLRAERVHWKRRQAQGMCLCAQSLLDCSLSLSLASAD